MKRGSVERGRYLKEKNIFASVGMDGLGNKDLLDSLTGASTLPVAISSVLIFDGFSRLNVKKDITRISKLSFLVYLFHAGV